jgi:hypothetical protein
MLLCVFHMGCQRYMGAFFFTPVYIFFAILNAFPKHHIVSGLHWNKYFGTIMHISLVQQCPHVRSLLCPQFLLIDCITNRKIMSSVCVISS